MKQTRMAICLVVALACASPTAGETRRLALNGAGESAFADLESSATFALPPPGTSNWRLSITLEGTPSNCVEIALGRDTNTNAVLDADELTAALGWDRGVWFASGGPGLEERFTAAPSGESLTLDISLSASGAVRLAAFREGATPLPFADMPPAPAWLAPRLWDTARLTARGGGARAETAEIRTFRDGTSLIVK